MLINKIFEKLAGLEKRYENYTLIRRLIKILQKIIVISEKKGLRVKPHKAVLKGDMLHLITVKYYVADVQDFTRNILVRQITV